MLPELPITPWRREGDSAIEGLSWTHDHGPRQSEAGASQAHVGSPPGMVRQPGVLQAGQGVSASRRVEMSLSVPKGMCQAGCQWGGGMESQWGGAGTQLQGNPTGKGGAGTPLQEGSSRPAVGPAPHSWGDPCA